MSIFIFIEKCAIPFVLQVKPITYHKEGWSRALELALRWWHEVLSIRIQRTRPWCKGGRRQVHLFCDARGSPPHLAAVLFADGAVWHTNMAVPQCVLDNFEARQDNQIMGLEILSIALGMHISPRPLLLNSQINHASRYVVL